MKTWQLTENVHQAKLPGPLLGILHAAAVPSLDSTKYSACLCDILSRRITASKLCHCVPVTSLAALKLNCNDTGTGQRGADASHDAATAA